MAYENLLFEVKDQIARITFNRPNVLNALNLKTVDELGDCLEAIERDDSVRVIIFTGAGEKAFVAGADINELATRTPVDGQRVLASSAIGPASPGNDGQAIDCRDQWIRAGRRLRIRARLHDAHREPQRETWPAGSEAGLSSGIRRLAAALAPVRQGNRPRNDSHGRDDLGGRSVAHRPGESRRRTRRNCCRQRKPSRRKSSPTRRWP